MTDDEEAGARFHSLKAVSAMMLGDMRKVVIMHDASIKVATAPAALHWV